MTDQTSKVPDWAAKAAVSDLKSKLSRLENELPVIHLSQSSFANGTYRIQTSARYVLTEDIRFNPNPSTYENDRLVGYDWMPTPEQISSGKYPVAPAGPYHMGFFAAITIETNNVIIDLNGFTLEQHMEHYIQQRFFSIIELAASPFIHGQGPSDFGPFRGHKNIKIHNGTLGLSSHQSIHGNGTEGLVLEDLTCYDYEQACVQVNGGSLISMDNIQIERNSQDALVRATYSQGRFIRSFLRRIIAAGDPIINVNGTDLTGSQILSDLESEMDGVYNDIINLKKKPDSELFRNPDPLNTCDGSVYGIVLNKLGAAVGAFITSSTHEANRLICLKNISICGLHSDPVEIPALCVPEDHNKAQRGPVGDVLRIMECTGVDGQYVPDVLSNAQLYWNKHAALIGTTAHASPGIYNDWASGNRTINDVMDRENICYMYGRDAMSHIMKGNIGIFLSGTSAATLENISMRGISNRGAFSKGNDHKSYEGNRTRGFAITACKSLDFTNVSAMSLSSTTADVYGMDFIHPCSDICLSTCSSIDLNPALFVKSPEHQGHCDAIRGKSLVTNLVVKN